jgi:3-hydroxybutyryl-CoA dehydrogenase
MKVLLLATDKLKEELLSQPVTGDIQLHWIKEPEKNILPGMDACIDLLFNNKKERIEWLSRLNAPLVVINSVIIPLKEIRDDFIRINGWAGFLERPIIEASAINETLKAKAEQLFSCLGRKTEWVPDVAGFITPRVVATVINEAFLALEENVSVETEIDTAMKLGTNYPYGPFEWGQKIGLQNIHSLLDALSKEQIRYKPSKLLKEKTLV